MVSGDFDRAREIKGINFENFKLFMTKFITKMKGQTCWRMLKHFGYDNKLRLKKSLWDDGSISESQLKSARSFELQPEGMLYLSKIFKSHSIDVNGKQYLDQAGIEKIFHPCLEEPPFDPRMSVNMG